mmetsp:Transcript_82759/g.101465  ORF Transcript_82759/g.101465 Transcript_82759/m.101465 type:complete len:103 (+) Transcript_82759:135-443(+)
MNRIYKKNKIDKISLNISILIIYFSFYFYIYIYTLILFIYSNSIYSHVNLSPSYNSTKLIPTSDTTSLTLNCQKKQSTGKVSHAVGINAVPLFIESIKKPVN